MNKSDYIDLSKELLNTQKEISTAKMKEKKIKGKIELLLKEGLPITSKD